MLWRNVEHFAVRSKHVTAGTIADLRNLTGRKFSIGKRNSGTEGSGLEILTNLGIDPEATFDIVNLGYGPSADALQNGTIDGFNMPGGVPVSALTRAFASLGDGLVVLDFTDDQLDRANGGGALWTRHVVPAGKYPGQDREIRTHRAAELPGRARRCRRGGGLPDHQDDLRKPLVPPQHPQGDESHVPRQGPSGLPAPLHPGAARYYREVGIEIPVELIAP